MKKINLVLTVLGFFFMIPNVSAQKKNLQLSLDYNYSLPISSFKSDLVSHGSPRGFLGSIMYSFNDKLQAGVGFGFQDYYQKFPRKLYKIGKSQDVSAVLSNSIQTTPLILKAKYFPFSTSFLKPYISIGAGANLVNFNQYLGEFGSGETKVKFRAEGGIGLFIPVTKSQSSGINIGANYGLAPYSVSGYKNLNTLNFQAGVSIHLK